MPIGKDSITKRVAKPAAKDAQVKEAAPVKQVEKEEKIAPELVATAAAAPAKKPAAKKTSASTAKKPSAAKKPAVEKTAPAEEKVTTGVLSSVAPETVEAVIGHKEDEKYEKVRIGQKMPDFLL